MYTVYRVSTLEREVALRREHGRESESEQRSGTRQMCGGFAFGFLNSSGDIKYAVGSKHTKVASIRYQYACMVWRGRSFRSLTMSMTWNNTSLASHVCHVRMLST